MVVDLTESASKTARRGPPEEQPPEQPPRKAQKTQAQAQTLPPGQLPPTQQVPLPAPQAPNGQEGGQDKPAAPEKPPQAAPEKPPQTQAAQEAKQSPEAEPEAPPAEGGSEAAPAEEAVLDLPDGGEGEDVWDARVLVVRQGQVHIEIQHRKPPMRDPTLLRFCDWLDQQLPVVVANFPYVRKSGAYVDLSDNIIGPEGLDKLFRVLRDHRVPCVVMKAYRNVLDDSIVDTLIEYLYTQPESFPMHGIHISHNNITDKGALRLIRAAALCGHYPRLTSRLPLWLRLEANDIQKPYKMLADCQKEGFNVCLMGNGLCSRPDCNHYAGVHVQLPYFLNQGQKGQDQYLKERSVAKAQAPVPALPPPEAPAAPAVPEPVAPVPDAAVEPPAAALADTAVAEADDANGVQAHEEDDEALPDWKRKERLDTRASLMVPAPKTTIFRPAPKVQCAPRRLPPPAPEMPPVPVPEVEELPQHVGPAFSMQPAHPAMGMQRIVRPSAPVDLGPPPPPLGPPPMEAYAAAISAQLELVALGTSPKASQPGCPALPPTRPPPPGGGFFAQGDAGVLDGWRGAGRGFGGGGRPGIGFKEAGRGGKGVAKWGGNRMWQGPTLQSKAKKDVRLEGDAATLGFQWRFFGEGHAPKVMTVEYGSKVSEVAQPGDSLLRVNGLDVSMFSERQIADMLKQRPLALRFGDE